MSDMKNEIKDLRCRNNGNFGAVRVICRNNCKHWNAKGRRKGKCGLGH